MSGPVTNRQTCYTLAIKTLFFADIVSAKKMQLFSAPLLTQEDSNTIKFSLILRKGNPFQSSCFRKPFFYIHKMIYDIFLRLQSWRKSDMTLMLDFLFLTTIIDRIVLSHEQLVLCLFCHSKLLTLHTFRFKTIVCHKYYAFIILPVTYS